MGSFRHGKEGNVELSEEILQLLKLLVTREEEERATFDHVNVDGSNVGAVLNVRQSRPTEVPDCCSINIYVSNNIQGVNNSILVGSEVKMGEPGLGLSFGDIKWERDASKMKKMTSILHRFGYTVVFLCVLVLLVSVLLALFRNR